MRAIVAADEHWGIGKDNKLLAHIPEDMLAFREQTMNKVVVMGRKTLESFPGKKPLKNRINIVLTSDRDYTADGAIIVHSERELYEELRKYNTEFIYVIGGESIYNLLINSCRRAYVTYIDKEYDADTHFPNLDERPEWTLIDESSKDHINDDGTRFRFRTYIRFI